MHVVWPLQTEFTNLTDGFHLFEARATDAAGNVQMVLPTSAVNTTVDTIAPVLRLTSVPPLYSLLPSQEVCVAISDATGTLGDVRVDVYGWAGNATVGLTPTDAVVVLNRLTGCGTETAKSEGNFTLTATAVDAAGNSANPVSTWFVYDATPPRHNVTWLMPAGCATVNSITVCDSSAAAVFSSVCVGESTAIAVSPCRIRWSLETQSTASLLSNCVCNRYVCAMVAGSGVVLEGCVLVVHL